MMQPDFGFTMALLVAVATFATTPPFVAITTELIGYFYKSRILDLIKKHLLHLTVLASIRKNFSERQLLIIRLATFLVIVAGAAGFMHSLEEVIAVIYKP